MCCCAQGVEFGRSEGTWGSFEREEVIWLRWIGLILWDTFIFIICVGCFRFFCYSSVSFRLRSVCFFLWFYAFHTPHATRLQRFSFVSYDYLCNILFTTAMTTVITTSYESGLMFCNVHLVLVLSRFVISICNFSFLLYINSMTSNPI
ncbi:hypothetical protein BJ165DRAFT_1464101 [Panaeolus papilionaceus]|nr:hypothetical protein BJ165DRAFT_1464101 [Panaeolus papilionaceus]